MTWTTRIFASVDTSKWLGRRVVFTMLSLWLIISEMPAQRSYDLARWNIPPANYSGITSLGGDRYAVVSDKEPQVGFYIWQIQLDSHNGEVQQVVSEGFFGVPYATDRDAEGIAYCPQRGTLFISGEADQRILEHRLDGSLTGHELSVPAAYGVGKIQSNRGFEALGYDSQHQRFWTVTESSLRGDEAGRLRVLSFGRDLRLADTFAYQLSPEQAANHGRDHYHGVVAIAPLSDGRLLTLERECRIAPRYNGSTCWCRLYCFTPKTGKKTLVEEWSTSFGLLSPSMANYEGMCLGPRLVDGRQTALLVSDSQAGYGIGRWHLRDYLRVVILPAEY